MNINDIHLFTDEHKMDTTPKECFRVKRFTVKMYHHTIENLYVRKQGYKAVTDIMTAVKGKDSKLSDSVKSYRW